MIGQEYAKRFAHADATSAAWKPSLRTLHPEGVDLSIF